MANLNEMMEDELSEEEITKMSKIDFSVINDLEKLTESSESLREKISIRDMIVKKNKMSKEIADSVNDTFVGLFSSRLSAESFSELETKTNLDVTKVFMDNAIIKELDSTNENLKRIFSEGLDEVLNYVDKFVNEFKPDLEEKYFEVQSQVSANELSSKNSYLLADSVSNKIVDIYTMPFKDLAMCNLTDDSKESINLADLRQSIIGMTDLIKENPKLGTFISVTSSDRKTVITAIYSTYADTSSLCIKDIINFFTDTKGLYYIESIKSLLDKVVNFISFKKMEFDGSSSQTGTLSGFVYNIKDEAKEAIDMMEYVRALVNGLPELFKISKLLTGVLK